MKKNKISDFVLAAVSVVIVCLFPIVFLYTRNAGEAMLSECVFPAALFCGTGLLLLTALSLLLKKPLHAGLITDLALVALLNFFFLEAGIQFLIWQNMRYWQCLSVLIIVLLHFGILICRKVSAEGAHLCVLIVSGVFGILMLINMATAVPTLLQRAAVEREAEQKRKEQAVNPGEAEGYLPNVYYILADEYSSFRTLEECYDYDNSEFKEFLEEKGFAISPDSFNDEINTSVVTANLQSLDYVVTYEDNTAAEFEAMRKNSRLFAQMRAHGYQIRGIANAAYYGLEREDKIEKKTSATINGDTFEELILNYSVFYPIFKRTVSSVQNDALLPFAYLKNAENYQSGGIFTMAHMDFPHQPFLFDQNGGLVSRDNRDNWHDKEYYLNQLIYCTGCLQETISAIIEREPDAIIILQSDHSARANSDSQYGYSLFMHMIPYENMKSILNAVYLGGKDITEIQGQSGVNTLRLLLNRMFDDCNYDVVDVPYGSYEKYISEHV